MNRGSFEDVFGVVKSKSNLKLKHPEEFTID